MKKVTITTVSFCGAGDGITAMYVDGELNQYGDDYHNRIVETIGGFIAGVKYGIGEENVEEVMIHLVEEHPLVSDTWDKGNPPPNKLSDINEDDRI